jgi:PAS domain S-box-containing protein
LGEAMSLGHAFEIIFLNLNLSDSKGIKTFKAIKNKFAESAIVILTTLAEKKDALAAIKLGAEDYLMLNSLNKEPLQKTIDCIKEKRKRTPKSSVADYKKFFMDSPVPMWIFDSESFDFLDVNIAAVEHYGYSRREFINMSVFDIRPDEDVDPMRETIKKLEIQRDYTDVGHWRHKKKNGDIFYAHIHTCETVYKGRKARMAIAIDEHQKIVTDIENKELNEALIRQKEQMDDIMSSLTEVVWSCRADTYDLIYANEAIFNVYGYTADEIKADRSLFYNAIHPDDKEKFMGSFAQMFAKGYVLNEFRVRHKDGNIKYLTGVATLKKGRNGDPDIFSGVTTDITAIKEAEHQLKEKVKQIENILESTTDAFIAVDKNWKINYINKEFEKIFKKTRKELLGKNLWKSFPAMYHSNFHNYFHHAMDEWGSVHFEALSPSSGRILSTNIYPTETGLAIFMKDVTEERQMQDKIANEERKLRAIINNTEDIIWLVDTELNTTAANQAYYSRVASLTPNKNFSKLMPDDLEKERVEKWRNYYEKAFAGELHKLVEEDRVNGRTVYEEISFNRIFDKNNKVTGLSCFSRDITEEKKLRDTIAKNEHNLRALINNTNDFIWSVDRDLKVISINEPFRDFIYAFTKRIINPGDSIIFDEFGPEMREKWKKSYEQALSGKRVILGDEEIINGKTQRREKSLHPIVDQDGAITGVSCYARDISELVKQLTLIKQQNERLKEIAWLQSHKVRGPLTSIMGLIELFNFESSHDNSNLEVLSGIRSASLDLDNIIREIVGKTASVQERGEN